MPGVIPLPPRPPQLKRTTDVLQKPDNSKSYRQAGAGRGLPREETGGDCEFLSTCVNNALMEHAFRHLYQHNLWGDPESVSGPGSGLLRTEAFRDHIAGLLSDLGAKSLLDAGCGDFN